MNRRNRKYAVGGVVLWSIWATAVLVFWVAAIVVAIHFIAKWW